MPLGEIGRWITCSYNDLLSLIREFLKLNVKITLFVFAHIIYFYYLCHRKPK